MFFLAKVCACGVYVLGLVEAILDVFGVDPGESSKLFIPVLFCIPVVSFLFGVAVCLFREAFTH